MNALRTQPFTPRRVLVTGANGYVGTLAVASLLHDTAANITCLVRPGHALQSMIDAVAAEWQALSGTRWRAAVEQRLSWMTVPADAADLPDLAPALAGTDEIVHCAGCLDYHHETRLHAANVVFTAHLLMLARRLKLARFVHVSTAYSGGFGSGPVPEAPLPEPASDPTLYTRSKRHAERLVAASGVPFVVLRPSILIGDSTSGRYSGKRYGLVQQWESLAELSAKRWQPELHVVTGSAPLNLLHQDAFCAAFQAAHRWLPDGAYANLVSDAATAPTLHELWQLWFEVAQPARVHWHATLADVPLRRIAPQQRAYLHFARINLGIASHAFAFDTRWLALLRERGLVLANATPATVRVCQDRFVAGCAAAQQLQADAQRSAAARNMTDAAQDMTSAGQTTADAGRETSAARRRRHA